MRISSFLALLACLWFSVSASAQRYAMTDSVPFAGAQTYWDYLIVDASSHQLYVTRGNEVLIVDLPSGKEVARIANLKRVLGAARKLANAPTSCSTESDSAAFVTAIPPSCRVDNSSALLSPDRLR